MYSDVRLVIWDLDETYWGGTLCEGGVQYNEDHHDIVVKLCERGIMNSICSRNDFERVENVLREKGIWDYFIFPSINWTSKADRIAKIIELAQLRAETVLFVDDNAGNRAQVLAAIPGIQIADQPDIRHFLTDPGFIGSPDTKLGRLEHYKILEKRQSALNSVGGSNLDFLLQSNIVVEIIHNVEDHLDRAVELINRTNQLNFTKRRLPEDLGEAKRLLLAEINDHHARVGLVSVRDRYGDYGICGFFLVQGLDILEDTKAVHFLFSCRCLGMGVGQWVYEVIGRPKIDIVGEVVSDLSTDVSWINIPRDEATAVGALTHRFRDVRLRGGCEFEVLEHYFKAQSTSCTAEHATPNGSFNTPTHHSAVLSKAILGLSKDDLRLLKMLQMNPSYFETQFFAPCKAGTLLVYSPSTDAVISVYQHRKSGFELPIFLHQSIEPGNEARTKAADNELNRIKSIAKNYYDRISFDDFPKYISWYKTILDRVPANALLLIILPNYLENKAGAQELVSRQATFNELFKVAGKDRANVGFIEITSLLESIDDVKEGFYLHYRRAVYRRLYESIEQHYTTWMAAQNALDNRPQSVGQKQMTQAGMRLSHAEKPQLAVA